MPAPHPGGSSPQNEIPSAAYFGLFEAMVKRMVTDDANSEQGPQKRRRGKGRAPVEPVNDNGGDDQLVDDNTEPGSLTEYKPFYEHKNKEGRTEWTIEEPADIADPVEGKATAKYAFLVRFKKSYDTRKKYDIDSVIIQSPLLKEQLGQALAGYPGITTSLDRLTFQAPFRPFVHRWQRLTDLLESTKTANTLAGEHLKLFLDLLYTELKQAIDAKVDLVKNGVITFEFLWTLFEPETLVYGEEYGQERVWELVSATDAVTQGGTPFLSLSVWSVDFDGSSFGRKHKNLAIYYFEGTAKITGLDYKPLEALPNRWDTATTVIERGKLFESFAGYHYQSYTGVALGYSRCGMIRHNISSRVIVDCEAHNRLLPNHAVNLNSLGKEGKPFTFWGEEETSIRVQPEPSNTVAGNFTPAPRSRRGWARMVPHLRTPSPVEPPDKSAQRPLTTKELLLSAPYVRGFALKSKTWLWFFVAQITPIAFNDRAFDSLVLPQHQKRLINAFVKTQAGQQAVQKRGTFATTAYSTDGTEHSKHNVANHKDQTQGPRPAIFDDVIAGKGLGIILLLSGPPGVGKTLTAESVSENLRVPLYVMSAGDLGLEPAEIEEKLSNVMDMVSKWGAVLLLDEADVFLEARSGRLIPSFLPGNCDFFRHAARSNATDSSTVSDLERNKLVSIFLRMLEYYTGILFLTTNRIKNIDEAFHSRIHVTVQYPSLSRSSRRYNWEGFLGKLTGAGMENGLTEEEVEELSKLELNGRVIKNVVKTAGMVARSEWEEGNGERAEGKVKLEMGHIRTVLAIEKGED